MKFWVPIFMVVITYSILTASLILAIHETESMYKVHRVINISQCAEISAVIVYYNDKKELVTKVDGCKSKLVVNK